MDPLHSELVPTDQGQNWPHLLWLLWGFESDYHGAFLPILLKRDRIA